MYLGFTLALEVDLENHQLMVVDPYQGNQIFLQSLIKLGREWVIVAKVWETLVDCSDILDVVEFDLLKILLLIDLSCIRNGLIEFLIRFGGSQLFPVI